MGSSVTPPLCFSSSAVVRAEGDGRCVRCFDVEIAYGEGPNGSGKLLSLSGSWKPACVLLS